MDVPLSNLAALRACIIEGDHLRASDLTIDLVKAGQKPMVILEDGLLPGMDVIGARFRNGEIFLPEVLVSARAMKSAMNILQPLLEESNFAAKGKILLATVKGDVHDIGKNLVAVMLRGAGFTVVDCGTNCPVDKILGAVRDHRPDVVGLSAMLTTTMPSMATVIEALRASGEQVPVVVGGAPLSKEYALSIGAAGYARTAGDAVELIKRLMEARESPATVT